MLVPAAFQTKNVPTKKTDLQALSFVYQMRKLNKYPIKAVEFAVMNMISWGSCLLSGRMDEPPLSEENES